MKVLHRIILALVLMVGASVAQAWPYHGGYHGGFHSYHSVRVYHYGGYHNGFVPGVVAGAIIGGAIYNASRPVYVEPVQTIPPDWVVTYRQVIDPSCNCYITIRQYQDSYGNYHSYP